MHMRILIASLALVAVGCGTSVTPADAGTDAPTSTTDAGIEEPIDSGPPDGGCDIAPIPGALPTILGGLAVSETDGGSAIPVATGGDPVGLWVFDRATFYVSPTAATMFDVATSTVEGTAWVAVDADEARLDFRFVTTLMGTPAGTIVRPSSTQVRATYTVDGPSVSFEAICAQSSAGSSSGSTTQQFSVDGDAVTWITQISGAAGPITIVLEGTRRTTP